MIGKLFVAAVFIIVMIAVPCISWIVIQEDIQTEERRNK